MRQARRRSLLASTSRHRNLQQLKHHVRYRPKSAFLIRRSRFVSWSWRRVIDSRDNKQIQERDVAALRARLREQGLKHKSRVASVVLRAVCRSCELGRGNRQRVVEGTPGSTTLCRGQVSSRPPIKRSYTRATCRLQIGAFEDVLRRRKSTDQRADRAGACFARLESRRPGSNQFLLVFAK